MTEIIDTPHEDDFMAEWSLPGGSHRHPIDQVYYYSAPTQRASMENEAEVVVSGHHNPGIGFFKRHFGHHAAPEAPDQPVS
ncbi:MAG TPA: hypothetical protein VLG13_02960 [Patescibacteria group bacterium]|nr:hypothetical protein [Patescibacteria group bacterium]